MTSTPWKTGASITSIAVFLMLAAACNPRKPADAPPPTDPPAATPAVRTPQADPCDSAVTQMAMNACYGEKARIADSLETVAYAGAKAALHQKGADDRMPQLEAAEKAWAAYRDAQCQAEAGLNEGGSIAGLVVATCRSGLAGRRTEELNTVYVEWARQ
jgi:uncharacterized protein YecT (DUF1311 family)